MEFFLELLFNLLGELLLQLLGELLVDFGLRSLVDGDTARRHPVVCLLGNALLGAVAGGISLLIFGEHCIKSRELRIVALFLVPPLAGWLMSLFGKWQEKHGGERAGLERFSNGFTFALTMGAIRLLFAK